MASSGVVITQPQPVIVHGGDWSSGICDCTNDMKDCCFSCWCIPCHACVTTDKYGQCLCLPLLDWFGIIPPVAMAMRFAVRQRYGIQGTMCTDCVYATFCYPCTWCQISRELKSRV